MPGLSQGGHQPNGPEMTPIHVSTGDALSITLQTKGDYCWQESGMHRGVEGKNVLELYKTWYGMFRWRLLADWRTIRLLVLFVLCWFCSFCLCWLMWLSMKVSVCIVCMGAHMHVRNTYSALLLAGPEDTELWQPSLCEAAGFGSSWPPGSASSVHWPERV